MSDKSILTGADRLLGFTLPDRDCRGRIVRLGPVLDEILAAHDYPPALAHCLAEALVLTVLMGGLLKDSGDQLTLQAQSQGGIAGLLVCDYRDGQLRGYIEHDPQRSGELAAAIPTLSALFGSGHLAITFDIAASGKRYQGIVPLEGDSLSSSVEGYFAQSEQVPTRIRTAIRSGPEGLTLEDIVWRLYHEEREVRVAPGPQISRGCRCTVTHFEDVLARFPKEDRREMADEEGIIVVDCAFCSKKFAIQD
jgi:molecular chaperone Hsp33